MVTRFPDNALIGNPPGVPVAAKSGHILTLWVTGSGPTQPPTAAGAGRHHQRANPGPCDRYRGKHRRQRDWGGRDNGIRRPVSDRLYQIAIQLPDSIGLGDEQIVASVGGFQSSTEVNLYIANP